MNAIENLRKNLGISQYTLAEKLDVTQSAISQWETGAAMPRADKLPELAKILGCEVSDLFEENL